MTLVLLLTAGGILAQNTFTNSGTNVGIGTTSPSAKIEVINNNLVQSNPGGGYTWNQKAVARFQTRGYIVTTTPPGGLPSSYRPPNHKVFEVVYTLTNNNPWSQTDQSLLVINSNRTVGINNANPTATLDVDGSFNTSNDATVGGDIHVTGSADIQNIVKVGVQNTSLVPGAKLVVQGEVRGTSLAVKNPISANTEFKVDETGHLYAREIDVNLSTIPDYVFHAAFDKDSLTHYQNTGIYKQMSLESLEKYVMTERHQPGIASAEDYQAAGKISLNKLTLQLLEKVEELTLYNIELNNRIRDLEKQIKK